VHLEIVSLRDSALVPEPEHDDQRQQTRQDEGCDGGDHGDCPNDAERVGLEEQSSERCSLEHGLRLRLGRCIGRGTLGVRHGGGAQLGVGLPATDLVQVNGDEIVGVDLSLGASRELLSCVLRDGGDHRWRDLASRLGVSKRSCRRERNLLLGKLVVYVGVGKARPPQQQSTGDDENDHHDGAPDADQEIEHLALHLVFPFFGPIWVRALPQASAP